MTKEESIEVFKERGAKFRDTRSIQWKANISIWTLLALLVAKSDDIYIFPDSSFGTFIIGFLFVFIHFMFCYLVQRSLEYDRALMDLIKNNWDTLQQDDNILIAENEIEHQQGKGMLKTTTILWLIIQPLLSAFLYYIYLLIR